jgi:hypothetical protein
MERTTAPDAIGSQPYDGERPRVDAGVLDDLKASLSGKDTATPVREGGCGDREWPPHPHHQPAWSQS